MLFWGSPTDLLAWITLSLSLLQNEKKRSEMVGGGQLYWVIICAKIRKFKKPKSFNQRTGSLFLERVRAEFAYFIRSVNGFPCLYLQILSFIYCFYLSSLTVSFFSYLFLQLLIPNESPSAVHDQSIILSWVIYRFSVPHGKANDTTRRISLAVVFFCPSSFPLPSKVWMFGYLLQLYFKLSKCPSNPHLFNPTKRRYAALLLLLLLFSWFPLEHYVFPLELFFSFPISILFPVWFYSFVSFYFFFL